MSPLSAAELFNVNDMVFVVTGGGSGIGTMMAKALDENGAAKVYILGRRLEKLEEVAKAAVNKSMIPIKADVTSKDDLAAAATRIKSEAGFVNVVIANSGIVGPTLEGLPKDRTPTIDEVQEFLWKVPQDDFTNTFAVNATAMFYTLTAFLSLLDAGNHAHSGSPTVVAKGIKSQFIVTSSLAGFSRRVAAGIAYSGSKAAATHMVKNMATFLVPYHIRANVIAPGIYPSEINNSDKKVTEEGFFPQTTVPLTRAGTEEDMAGAVLSLCGRGGAYYNGHVVLTDGGRISVLPSTY